MKVLQALALVEDDVRKQGMKVDLEEIKKITMQQMIQGGYKFSHDDQILKSEEDESKETK